MTDSTARIVPVEILGQRYPVRSSLDAVYVAELATYVDKKMRAAADVVQTGDSVRLAVLAALNIADEYFRCRNAEQVRQSELNERAARVEQLLDQALDQLGTPAGSGS